MNALESIKMPPLLRWCEPLENTGNVLLCFPHAGGGASLFRPWLARHKNLAVAPVQLPGREERGNEHSYKTMDDLLEDLLPCMTPYLSGKKIYLFGHSMGAIIATALALKLQDAGLTPDHVFVSGLIAPHYRNPAQKLHQLDSRRLWNKILSLNGTPDEISFLPELLYMMEGRLRTDLELCENWSFPPNSRLSCQLSILYGNGDAFLNPEGIAGWQDLTTRHITYRSFAGDHFYLKHDMRGVLDFILQSVEESCHATG
jgi:surfactin synthase thioesterase subunit